MNQGKTMTLSGSAAYFDQVAEQYLSSYHARSPAGYALRVRLQRVLELMDQPRGKVLDVGCGPGILARELLNSGYDVWGVDASPSMIEQCRKQFEKNNRAHFTTGDAKSLPFPEEFFDTVICMGVIGSVTAGESALKEMARIVKKNGTLLISFPNLLSPYAAWKNFVFYPALAMVRPIYYRLAGRSQPPSLYGLGWRRPLRSLPLFFPGFQTARTVVEVMTKYGAEVTDIVYFNFNVFLSPLDELFPRWTLKVIKRLEQLRFGKLKWLGAGFILKAKRRS